MSRQINELTTMELMILLKVSSQDLRPETTDFLLDIGEEILRRADELVVGNVSFLHDSPANAERDLCMELSAELAAREKIMDSSQLERAAAFQKGWLDKFVSAHPADGTNQAITF